MASVCKDTALYSEKGKNRLWLVGRSIKLTQFKLPLKLLPPSCLIVNRLGLDASSLRDSFPPYFIIMPNSDFQNILIHAWLKQKGISQVVLVINNPSTNVGDIRALDSISGSGRSPGRGHTATYSSSLAWKIPSTEEPGGLQSKGHKESDTTEVTQHTHTKQKNVLGKFYFLYFCY